MAAEGGSNELVQVVALLGAGVVAVPIFRRLGLGSVLGYFAAGIVIGPFAIGLFPDPASVLHVAEFGVIMLLFIIGLEMQPSRLWGLRREIFGLGLAQVAVCGALLTFAGILAGLSAPVAFVAGMGFVLSSTAVVMQMLDERGDTSTPAGQKAVSILLLEDLAIVPLLAIVAFLAPQETHAGGSRLTGVAIALAAIIGLVVAGRYLLNPMFKILARSKAREVMTAAALLVVLGSALLMDIGGLSMAMGAFLAGVMLSESTFRHQLEADIEPFRGILLGLFFLAVGMSLDLPAIAANWGMVAAAVVGFVAVKAAGIFVVARLFGSNWREAVDRTALFAQGGEFAFVLYAAATASGVMDARENAVFTAAVIISMALTPFTAIALKRLMPPRPETSLDNVERADGLTGSVLIVGFGRFGQMVSQPLLARGFDVSIIELDVEMIEAAAEFGFKVYYGDGTRLDVLRTSGAGEARAIVVCADGRQTASKIADLARHEFSQAQLYVRAYDRGHAIDLIRSGVDYQLRETFESAMAFGEAVLIGLDVPEEEAAEIVADVRKRDEERLTLQVAGDIYSGIDLVNGNAPIPSPLTRPKRRGVIYDEALIGPAQPRVSGG
ncbi:monovalent cation:proton antiporter-2 (CPA2) family protein [Methylopila henanensis]|uniref:Monovalent cation:proton antiporter-2 (CPA2) family protein n=1 Tax=Methylopila henanensis TaxID=873516 RepID=A0ABW4K607_9HYPH